MGKAVPPAILKTYTMRKFIGSPKFDNLTDEEFEAWMDWYKWNAHPSNFQPKGKPTQYLLNGIYVTIHQLLEWWYYEHSGFSSDAKEKTKNHVK